MSKRLRVIMVSIVATFVLSGSIDLASAAPSNDNLASATLVPGLPFLSQRDTTTATMQVGEYSCYPTTSKSVWYKLVLNENPIGTFAAGDDSYVRTNNHNVAVVAHTLGSNYDTTISIYDGSPVGTNKVGCNNDIANLGAIKQSSVTLTLVSGHTYYISVAALGVGGSLRFSLDRAPLNDYIGEAYDASLPTNRFVHTNIGATLEPNESRSCFSIVNTLWYKRRSASVENVHADTTGSSFNTAVAVWQQSATGGFTPITCGRTEVNFTAAPGVTYLFQVGGAGNAVGGLVLNIERR
ncbi:MAG: hypothetical protein ABIS18_07595 [Actinomycetota bacterium]